MGVTWFGELMNKHWMLVVVIVMVLFGLSGCGSKGVNLSVEMTDFKFTPDTFTVPAGSTVNLKMHNMGALEHEYVIMVLGTDATVPFDSDDEPNIYWEHELEVGGEETLTFTAPSQPGEYNIVCGIAGHLEAGMRAKLTVTE